MPIYESDNRQPNVNVYPGGGNFGGGDSFGGNGAWWIIILFLFAMMSGWGRNGNGGGGDGSNSVAYIPYGGYGGMQQGFDQAAIMGGINGLQANVSNGFANAEVSRCNQQTNLLQSINGLGMSLQNCCCENRAATADLKYSIATEACADRQAVTDAFQALSAQNVANTNSMLSTVNAGIQSIKDQMCQDTIDKKNEKIAELQTQLTMANLAASQNAQTAAILANNEAQTTALEQYLAPVARPAYIVQNPNCCANYPNPMVVNS